MGQVSIHFNRPKRVLNKNCFSSHVVPQQQRSFSTWSSTFYFIIFIIKNDLNKSVKKIPKYITMLMLMIKTAVLAGNDPFLIKNIPQNRERFITQPKRMNRKFLKVDDLLLLFLPKKLFFILGMDFRSSTKFFSELLDWNSRGC